VVKFKSDRTVYVYVKVGKWRVQLNGREDVVLVEGDGAEAGLSSVESIGLEEAGLVSVGCQP
jgi:hypothetical protein